MIIKQEMAKTLSTLLAGLGVGLFPTLSFGLGLGDIEIESRLNQRLHARIEVVDVSDEEWQQIRARIAPRTLLSEASVHPEILESLNLRAIEAANHKHFIEVTSANVLTEPLFDLPVAVTASSLQVVRNYSVLLDPASIEDAPQGSPAAVLVQQAVSQSAAVPQSAASASPAHEVQARADGPSRTGGQKRVNGQRRVARHHRSRLARGHVQAAAAVKAAAVQAAPLQDTPPAKGASEQQQLEGQLTTLQQMVTKMQATIAAQDAEIAKLTAQVAARTESVVSRKAPVSPAEQTSSNETEGSSAGTSETRTRWLHSSHPLVYRLAGIVGGAVVLVLGAVAFIRRRQSGSSRDRYTREWVEKDAPGAEPKSDVLAWQSSLREAQSGTWRSPVKSTDSGVHEVGVIHVEETPADSDSPSGSSTAPSRTADPEVTTVATTVAMDELTASLEADLDALSASYESEHLQTSTGVLDEWRAQKEMLEREYLSDTEALPFVLEEGNRARSSETAQNPPLAAQTGVDEPTEEQPIPKAQEHMSPAQLLHLEMLQRSLREGKPDTNSEFVTDVAV